MRVLMLGIVVVVAALFPNSVQADDQQIADFVKARLQTEQQRGNLRGFNVDMRVDKGTIWFKGFVANRDQELLILRTAQTAGHLGVVQVVDDIELTSGAAAPQAALPSAANQTPQYQQQQNVSQQHSMFMQAAANDARASQVAYQEPLLRANPLAQQPAAPFSSPLQSRQPLPQSSSWQPSSYAPPAPSQSLLTQSRMPIASQGGVPIQSNRPLAFASAGAPCTGQDCYDGYGLGSPIVSNGFAGGPPPAPIGGFGGGGPGFGGGGGGGAGFESPNLPGYAWPGYAASPNYGALTYPKQYSPSAWPYIGPFYPYPQVPLGWRKVSLEWDDGWWFVDFHDKSQ